MSFKRTMMDINAKCVLLLCMVAMATAELCRNRGGYQDPYTFRLSSCASCYSYLFHSNAKMVAMDTQLLALKNGKPAFNTALEVDIKNQTVKDTVCATMTSAQDCSRWIRCCSEAEACCQQQQQQQQSMETDRPYPRQTMGGRWRSGSSAEKCPQTWDGFACWVEAASGSEMTKRCPPFLAAVPSRGAFAKKICTENGTWHVEAASGLEWTDYTGCVDMKAYAVETHVSIACCAISIITLLPATFIFLYYRTLRNQARIRLHLHLFASFIFTAAISLLWEVFIVQDRINNPQHQSRIHHDTLGCRVLYVLTRYSRCTNYVLMFCEALYLRRLIVHAFKPQTSIIGFVAFGWVGPVFPVAVYSLLKYMKGERSCWLHHLASYEWIIYLPNLFSLLANLLFLIEIMIILIRMQSHPNEPHSYRRALRATFILVPLFGLQLFVIIYRPPFGAKAWKYYEIIASAIKHSQGFFVALILCFVNKEVTNLLHSSVQGLTQQLRCRLRSQKRGGGNKRGISVTDSHDYEADSVVQPLNSIVTSF